jgi:hypothetical protein
MVCSLVEVAVLVEAEAHQEEEDLQVHQQEALGILMLHFLEAEVTASQEAQAALAQAVVDRQVDDNQAHRA